MIADLELMIIDIICTIWEGILAAYFIRVYTAGKTVLKKDPVFLLVFVICAEVMTFVSVPSLIKLLIEWVLFALVIRWIYKIDLIAGILSIGTYMLLVCLTEGVLTAFLGIFHSELRLENVIYRMVWYLVYHVILTIFVLIMRKVFYKVCRNFTRRENILMSILFAALILILASTSNRFIFGWEMADQIGQIIGLVVLIAVLFLLIYFMNESVKIRKIQQEEENELKKLQAQYQYYEERLKDEERVRRIYHDMKNHLLVLRSRMEQPGMNEKDEERLETEKMIGSLQKQISDYENYIQTGNSFLDIIIRDKAKAARDSGIDFHTEIDFSMGSFMDGLDISTIFGNALDNALEACRNVPEEEKFITVKAGVKNRFLVIRVENSAPEESDGTHTTKEDTFLHGFGLKNIRRAVEKYGGDFAVRSGDKVFSVTALVPLVQ